jgi:hypothetical protein
MAFSIAVSLGCAYAAAKVTSDNAIQTQVTVINFLIFQPPAALGSARVLTERHFRGQEALPHKAIPV